MKESSGNSSILRLLPSVDALLKSETARKLLIETGSKRLTEYARATIVEMRSALSENYESNERLTREGLLHEAEKRLSEKNEVKSRQSFQRVINATGVVIHTNLGRAPLAEAAQRAIIEEAARYCTLEYELETGKRGRRGKQAEDLLCELTGAEAALIVNNCAAAAFLVLSALASGGETIVSRGELVEIGGDFRVPDVMVQSGTRLVEVGTTNRTKLSDFANAITENTRVLMRVHPSNYRIVGFTAMPELAELAELARENNVLLYEDAGSGALVDLSKYGLTDEPVIAESIRAGADVVTFSGDKLLGGVQAGIVIGKSEAIEKLRKNPLYRALRVDKIAYSALAATLESFAREKQFDEIPVLRMLSMSMEELKYRCQTFVKKLQENQRETDISDLKIEIIEGVSTIGGGSAPMVNPTTSLISLRHGTLSAEDLERSLRHNKPPIIGRVAKDRILLDLRTVFESEEDEIVSALCEISTKNND